MSIVRSRQLAGDGRAGRWARMKARRVQHAYVRAHPGLLIGWVLTMTLPGLIAAAFVPAGFMQGALVGGTVVAAMGLVSFGSSR